MNTQIIFSALMAVLALTTITQNVMAVSKGGNSTSSNSPPSHNSSSNTSSHKEHHTSESDNGAAAGVKDGKVGVYDLAAACPSGSGSCKSAYKEAYVKTCTHSQFGCGDGPTTLTGSGGEVVRVSSSHRAGGSSGIGLKQIPSNKTDFPNNDSSVIQVHVTSAKKDTAGAYHVKGQITNIGNQTLNSVNVTAHLYDAAGNPVGNAISFTSPSNIDPGHTATFDSLATSDQTNGNPVSFRLTFDWS
jgi:hypothetical protein